MTKMSKETEQYVVDADFDSSIACVTRATYETFKANFLHAFKEALPLMKAVPGGDTGTLQQAFLAAAVSEAVGNLASFLTTGLNLDAKLAFDALQTACLRGVSLAVQGKNLPDATLEEVFGPRVNAPAISGNN